MHKKSLANFELAKRISQSSEAQMICRGLLCVINNGIFMDTAVPHSHLSLYPIFTPFFCKRMEKNGLFCQNHLMK